ncbi:TspO/MBR family protein [Clostridium beijerinckii]|uniref:Tryptophan-rich sensory protein n=1 Tax=Clostridium beijerinckii TaxID=1520 RepID=A0AAE5LS86_CLOBE|nr:TspO/MBR family protein [Clostridium beijerinckii]NSB16873.1 tryptophan-rich sensory protein [Clostridium beijerinckii]OOM30203.1 TspO/MBR family protein [Clostridium beijerinckii]
MSEKSGNKKKIRIIPLFASIIIPLLIGWLSTLLVPNMRSIYESLIKPPFSPPAMVFPIVWTILYIIMGICSYKVYILKYENIDVSSAIFVYAIQLLLNFLWTIIFFGFKLYALAFLELIILIIFVILTIKRFYEKIGNKAFLLIPYLAWLIYAGVLNFFIWMLNEM